MNGTKKPRNCPKNPSKPSRSARTENRGDRPAGGHRRRDWKRPWLDCLGVNDWLGSDPASPGAGFSHQAHLQIAVRNPAIYLKECQSTVCSAEAPCRRVSTRLSRPGHQQLLEVAA